MTKQEQYLEECDLLLLHNSGMSLDSLSEWEEQDVLNSYDLDYAPTLVVGWILSARGIQV